MPESPSECVLELRHALESVRFELISFRQVIGGKQGLEAAAELGGKGLVAVEGHLVALERMRLPGHAIRNAEAQEVAS